MFEITEKTIVARDGNFEEHPESYRPRVFVETCTNLQEYIKTPNTEPVMVVYELLTNGQAIVWPSYPDKETCGFDYWHLFDPGPGQTYLVRHTSAPIAVPSRW
jgi:hypothetical protein